MSLLSRLSLSRRYGTQPSFDRLHRLTTLRQIRPQRSDDPVRVQLRRVDELQQRVAAENSKTRKQLIIGEYPDLQDLLELIYDPQFRAHMSYRTLRQSCHFSVMPYDEPMPRSIPRLLMTLSDRQVVGHKAKSLVQNFLLEHDVLYWDPDQSTAVHQVRHEVMEVFGRLLDRNLIAGFGAKTLSSVKWKTAKPTETLHSLTTSNSATAASALSDIPSPKRNLKSFPVALGKSIEPPFSEIANSTCKWYASRKLDGVRVISFLDFLVPSDGSSPILQDVKFFSRTGKPFTSLAKVKAQMERLTQYPNLQELLNRDTTPSSPVSGGLKKRLVLDGEVCVMRERQAHQSSTQPDDGAGAIWSDNSLEEDFASTVSEIRRGTDIAHPVYFLFDMLPYSLFENAKGPSTFGQRVENIRQLDDWLAEQDVKDKILRPLAQWEIKDPSEIDGMVARAAEEGWEGLVLRADKAYKGARSSDIRKFKKWQDAEYTVIGHDMSRMRLAVDGVFGEYDALAAIWIIHKGVRVSVGSGFTADQRIKFGKNPELIVGKEVTIQYFSESVSTSREGLSLRFPRVKQIWDEGKRTM